VDDSPDPSELLQLAAATELLLGVAERINGDIVDEAILAELHELRDRAELALRHLAEQR
jgi:hypothetical protein